MTITPETSGVSPEDPAEGAANIDVRTSKGGGEDEDTPTLPEPDDDDELAVSDDDADL